MRAVILTLGLLLTGCPVGAGLADDFEDTLTKTGGCGDVVFYAHDEADETLLRVDAAGLVTEAHELGEATETTFELPADGITIEVEQGKRISDAICDDVIENGGPKVSRTWTAVGGTATITVRPGAEHVEEATADLLLEDVVLESEGDEVVIEQLELLDVSVGWLAG